MVSDFSSLPNAATFSTHNYTTNSSIWINDGEGSITFAPPLTSCSISTIARIHLELQIFTQSFNFLFIDHNRIFNNENN